MDSHADAPDIEQVITAEHTRIRGLMEQARLRFADWSAGNESWARTGAAFAVLEAVLHEHNEHEESLLRDVVAPAVHDGHAPMMAMTAEHEHEHASLHALALAVTEPDPAGADDLVARLLHDLEAHMAREEAVLRESRVTPR